MPGAKARARIRPCVLSRACTIVGILHTFIYLRSCTKYYKSASLPSLAVPRPHRLRRPTPLASPASRLPGRLHVAVCPATALRPAGGLSRSCPRVRYTVRIDPTGTPTTAGRPISWRGVTNTSRYTGYAAQGLMCLSGGTVGLSRVTGAASVLHSVCAVGRVF